MSIPNQLNEIIGSLKYLAFSNYVAIFSLFVSIIAIIVTIVTNYKNHKQYIQSIKPLLSFDFYESNGALLLSITNTGKTEAKNISVKVLQLRNNGKNNNLNLDNLFKTNFMLYPTEEVQGIIAYSGEDIGEEIFPVIDVKISFLNGNDNKISEYIRTITFKRNLYGKNQLSKIEDNIESISYSNNRLANYMEGRTLFKFDKLNVFPHNSLYKDMKDAFNRIEREEPTNNDTN